MNVPQPQSQGHTLEAWKTWEGRRELINGVAYDVVGLLGGQLSISLG